MRKLLVILGTALILLGTLSPAIPAWADSTTNLLNNPSVESLNGTTPMNWTGNTWGANTSSLSVSSDAHTGIHSLTITTTAYTSGDSKWMPDAISVTAGHPYSYSEYYKSSIATEVDAAYYDASNNVSYAFLQSVPASSTWQSVNVTFTAPSTAVRVVVLHILAAAGSLTTDDFGLYDTSAATPPPSGGNLIANPSFETANGTVPAGWQAGGWGTNTTKFNYLTSGHTGTRSANITTTAYTSGDAKWYFAPVSITGGAIYTFSDYYQSSVTTSLVAQFDTGSGSLTYQTLASIPAASGWAQTNVSFTAPATAKLITIFHLISSVGSLTIDDESLTTAAANPAPTISMSAPQAGSTVAGQVTVSATVNAPQGVTNVQFLLDGASLGNPVSIAPYQTTWNTASAVNGTHSLSAKVTASDGQIVTATAIQVTVSNATTNPGSNMFANPSLETVSPTNSNLPQGWNKSGWGTNTRTYSYLTTGHNSSRSVKTTISSFTNGAAYWSTADMPVVSGQMYDFSDYYQSNIGSEVDLTFTMSDGSVQYQFLGEASPSKNSWTKFRDQFTAPAGAVSVNIVHDIFAIGWVTTDDYSLTPFSYQGFNRAIVSLTFDDGWASFYNNGLPLLQKYGLNSTDYIISGSVNDTSYMTSAMVKALDAAGQEIGSHTVTHPDLTTLGVTKMDNELKNSQTFLQQLLNKPVVNFASPYGAYNQEVLTDAQKYYQSYRGVEEGYNAKNNFDIGHLMVQNMLDTTTLAEVQSWVAQAQATHTWLILVYHQVDPNPAAGEYNTYPSDLDAQLAAIKASGIAVETMNQALAEVKPQL